MADMDARIQKKCIPEPNSGCWLWTGALTGKGYGKISLHGRLSAAHRVSWETYRGKIPDGWEIDHRVCRLKCCVNPDHLVPCERLEHVAQPDSAPSVKRSKTHCPKGHPYFGANLYLTGNGGRACKICRDENVGRRKVKIAATAAKRHQRKKSEFNATSRAYHWANRDRLNERARRRYANKKLSMGDKT